MSSRGPSVDHGKFAEVRCRYEAGETLDLLARAYGVSMGTVTNYIRKAGGSCRRTGGKATNITGRPIALDHYVQDIERLDALSRQRALTNEESLRLEECIKRIARRKEWRRYSKSRTSL